MTVATARAFSGAFHCCRLCGSGPATCLQLPCLKLPLLCCTCRLRPCPPSRAGYPRTAPKIALGPWLNALNCPVATSPPCPPTVVASALGIPALLPFLKAVCQSKKSWQVCGRGWGGAGGPGAGRCGPVAQGPAKQRLDPLRAHVH